MTGNYVLPPISPETEAAWHLLSPFINMLDCNLKEDDESPPLPMNRSADLERLYNHEPDDEGAFYRPSFFAKRRLEVHRLGLATYYYRSKHNGVARTGYGQSDAASDGIPFAREIGIQGKVVKFLDVGIMLLGVDIDCHRKEPDVLKVRDWILAEFFPGAYSEPSTGGLGCHMYLRCAYPVDWAGNLYRTMQRLAGVVRGLSEKLVARHAELGFKAPVDGVRSAPTQVAWDPAHQRVRIVSRTYCIKIPRFARGLDDLVAFANSPFWWLPAFAGKQDQLGDGDHEGGGDHRVEEILAQDWEERVQDAGEEDITVRSGNPQEAVERLSREPDGFERKLGFALVHSRMIGHVPTGTDLNEAYKAAGLAQTTDDARRIQKFKGIAAYISRTFDPSRLGLDWSGWQKDKDGLVFRMRILLGDNYVLYRIQDRGEEYVHELLIEELAAVYWYVGYDDRHGREGFYRGACSYRQVQEVCAKLLSKTCPRHKAGMILRTLADMGLIKQTGGSVTGIRGSTYRPTDGNHDDLGDDGTGFP